MGIKETSCSEMGLWLIRGFVVVIILGILLRHDIFPSDVLPSFYGFAATLFAGLFVRPLTKWSSSGWDTQFPKRTDGGNSVELFSKPKGAPGPLILGLIEVSVFYVSFLVEAWIVVGGWLAFKAASKWAAWQHIMRIPEHLDELENISYLQYRHAQSSSLCYSFLVGTLSNVGAAFIGLAVKKLLGAC